MSIKVLSESLHTTARKTSLSLLATFTLLFSQTWVNYRGIMFFLSCSNIGVVYLIYLLGQGQWITIFPITLYFIHVAPNLITITNYCNNVKLYTSFFFILEAYGFTWIQNCSYPIFNWLWRHANDVYWPHKVSSNNKGKWIRRESC